MKAAPNLLQQSVLKRLKKGLPLTRWQRFRLHLAALQRHRRQMNLHTLLFQLRGILRTCNLGEIVVEPKKVQKTKRAAGKRRPR